MIDNENIILSNDYPAYVLASAGTGKTELIARKVEHLIIEKGVDIDKIALITFTNKATSETKDRIKKKIYNAWKSGKDNVRSQLDKIYMSKISTIHVFCDNIVREYSYELNLCPNYKISNLTLEKDKLANDIVKDNFNNEIFSVIPMYRIVKLLIDMEEEASDKGFVVELLKSEEITIWDKLRNYLRRIYPIYCDKLEEIKLKKGVITTNDLIKYAVKILQNEKLAPYIVNSIEYLFLDEAQDINFDQEKLVELLILKGVKVFIVGDEKQSIYAFRGSDKNAFNNLVLFIKERNGKQYSLEKNYRSNKFIIEKLNSLFSRNFEFKGNKINFKNQDLIASDNAQYIDKSIEIQMNSNITDVIKEIVSKDKNLNYSDIVVLCRTNREVMATYELLKHSDIPVQSFISKSIYKSKVLIDVVKLLNYIAGGGILEKEELFYTDWFLAINNISKKNNLIDITNNFRYLFKEVGVLTFISQMIEETHLFDFYEKIGDYQSVANLQRITEIIRDLEADNLTNMEILNFLNIMIVTGQEENQPQTNLKNSVIVSTIHTFKGLDGKIVIVNEADSNLYKEIDCEFLYSKNNGLFFNRDRLVPNSNIEEDKGFISASKVAIENNIEEELRLMYVVMTRAKEKLILHSKNNLNKIKFRISQDENYVSFIRWIYNI